jgi:hypothetical protein
VDQDTAFGQACPSNFHCSIYILAIKRHDPITVEDVLEAFKLFQTMNSIVHVQVWLGKRNDSVRTDIDEQQMMSDQVRFISIPVPLLLNDVTCHAVTSFCHPECPEHVGQMMKSPLKAGFNCAHFENYDKMYSTSTWKFPMLRSLVPNEGVIIPICPAYAVKSTSTKYFWGARMKQGIRFEEYFAPVVMIDSIHIMLCMEAAQGKQVYVLDIHNDFQTTAQFDASKRTYNMLSPFLNEYIHLHWPGHPDLPAILADLKYFAIQIFRSMQGKKDVDHQWYHLLKGSLGNIGLHHSVADHAIFTWKEPISELFCAIAMDDFLCLCDDSSQCIRLKTRLESIFEMTLQEGETLHVLNLRFIQSPQGIIIDQTDHIVDMVITP